MNLTATPLRRLSRAFAFARHVPVRQLWRRVGLSLKRKYRDRSGWPPPRAKAPLRLSASPPLPLFPPRMGMLAFGPAGPTFTFLGRAVAMQGDVDWSAPSLAPRDQLWRMHLHYMEYLEELDDAAFVELAEAWIAANSPVRRGAWRDSWNAYALSLRVVVWMQQLALRRERIAAASQARMTASLAEQLAFLADNLETDIGGNHLIKNIKALLWAGAYFEGPQAEAWRALGLERLGPALAEQVLPDGVHYERSPSYHAQVFADLIECRHALASRASPALDDALRRMAQATADLAHPDGFAAQFNDAGLHMAYPPAECLDAYAALFGDRPAARRDFAFPAAGYFGRRVEGQYLIVDCGRIGPDALPAHAHGDILSFEWSVGGQRIIVDPGVYEYFHGPRRSAARAAASHNTLCFEGADQADFFGSFRCGRRPVVEVRRYDSHDDRLMLEGTHDGFGRLGAHVRRFEATDLALTVVDTIRARRSQRARIGFLVHPEVIIDQLGAVTTLSRSGPRIVMRSTAKFVVEDAVWQPDLGYERATQRLSAAWEGGDGEVVTTFEIEASGTPR